MRKKSILVWAVLIGGAAAVAAWAPMPGEEDASLAVVAQTQPAAARNAPAAGANLVAALPAREPIGKGRGELFTAQSWAPPRTIAARAIKAVPAAAPAPTAPPMPYRVAGRVVHDGIAHVVLAKDDRVITVRPGDTLEDGYRVQSIGPEGVSLVYLPLGVAQTLLAPVALGPAPAPVATADRAAPAQAIAQDQSAALRSILQ